MNSGLRSRLSAVLATLGIVLTILYRVGWNLGFALAIAAFLAMIAVQFDRFTRLATVLLGIAGVSVAAALTAGRITLEDLDAAVFIFAFILTSGLLRQIALHDPKLVRLGEYLISIKHGMRFSVVSIVVAMQSVILLLGALQFFAGMVEARTRSDDPAQMATLLSGLIGFTLNPILSPMAIPFIVISSLVPELDWIDMLPALLSVAVAVWGVGFLQDRLNDRTPPARLEQQPKPPLDFGALLLALSPIAIVIVIKALSQLSLAESALVSIGLFALASLLRLDGRRDVFETGIVSARNEAAVIGGSIATGVALLSFLPDGALVGMEAIFVRHAVFLPFLIIAAFVLCGQIGLQPSICFLLFLPLINEILAVDVIVQAPVLAAVVSGWALNSVTSPVGVPVLIIGRAAGVGSMTVTWRANLIFTIAAPLTASLFLGLQM